MTTIVGARTTMEEVLELGKDLPLDPEDPPRPKTWGECLEVKRGTKENPCPYAGCKYHLAIDVTEFGSLVSVFPDLDSDEIPWTCALAFVEEHPDGATLEKVSEGYRVTRERIRQIEYRALTRLRTTKDEKF